MSHRLINLNEDLKSLKEEGYEVEIVNGFLVIHSVPYVTANREVKRGKLVSVLDLNGDATVRPSCHIAHFAGETPCDKEGQPLNKVINSAHEMLVSSDLRTNFLFSSKPNAGYANYYDKMTTYVALLEQHAAQLLSDATARTGRVIISQNDEAPFRYIDSATVRAGIWEATNKLRTAKVALIGLGGTGSYILDNLAKTPVQEIHVFDGDHFHQHNAFRAPGAPSIEELKEQLLKVEYFSKIYGQMHKGIFAHGYKVEADNIHELADMDFVFVAIDNNKARKLIVDKLMELNVPFIDVGMGLHIVDGSVLGVLRVTTHTELLGVGSAVMQRLPNAGEEHDNAYSSNIQVADLNMLNAAFAVMRWKRYLGFYLDLEREHHSTFAVDGNHLLNEDQAA